jgi:SAM-dependent methyltransferase
MTDEHPRPTADAHAELHDRLRAYYGSTIGSRSDLQHSACCSAETARRNEAVAALLPREVLDRHYGCGCPLPDDELSGLSVLDLGCGAGLDCFVAARKVGPRGRVHGLDMTAELLDVARRNVAPVTAAFGFERANVEFHEGYVETAAPIADESIDLVISDCVINLSPAKDEVFATAYRVLRDGGEIHFADVVADRRVPESIAGDPVLVAECLGGALYEHDLFDVMRDAGFGDPRVLRRSVTATDVAGEPITFFSVVVRAFKFAEPLDRRCEDYGQLATYRGTIAGLPARYELDDHHVFEAGRPAPVCRNTARMLGETRLARHFDVTAPVRHFGLFGACGATAPAPSAGGGCCC